MSEEFVLKAILAVALVATSWAIWRAYEILAADRRSRRNVARAPEAITEMRVVCAWKTAPDCKGVMHQGTPGAHTSHGICRPCILRLRARSASMRRRLNELAS